MLVDFFIRFDADLPLLVEDAILHGKIFALVSQVASIFLRLGEHALRAAGGTLNAARKLITGSIVVHLWASLVAIHLFNLVDRDIVKVLHNLRVLLYDFYSRRSIQNSLGLWRQLRLLLLLLWLAWRQRELLFLLCLWLL